MLEEVARATTKMSNSTCEIETATIKTILNKVENIWKNDNKTALILCETDLMDRYYMHRDVNIIDAKSLFLKQKMQNISKQELLQELEPLFDNA